MEHDKITNQKTWLRSTLLTGKAALPSSSICTHSPDLDLLILWNAMNFGRHPTQTNREIIPPICVVRMDGHGILSAQLHQKFSGLAPQLNYWYMIIPVAKDRNSFRSLSQRQVIQMIELIQVAVMMREAALWTLTQLLPALQWRQQHHHRNKASWSYPGHCQKVEEGGLYMFVLIKYQYSIISTIKFYQYINCGTIKYQTPQIVFWSWLSMCLIPARSKGIRRLPSSARIVIMLLHVTAKDSI